MSPFASSLLALAALLATAHGYCTSKHIGQYTDTHVDYEPVEFMPPGVEIRLDQNYCPYPMRVVGEDIQTCNKNPYGTAPTIDGPPDGQISPYTVMCGWDECPQGGITTVKQYCGY